MVNTEKEINQIIFDYLKDNIRIVKDSDYYSGHWYAIFLKDPSTDEWVKVASTGY